VEIAKTVGERLAVNLEQLSGVGAIDSGAEEELFRRIGQHAAGELLVKTWQDADAGARYCSTSRTLVPEMLDCF
jgi:hypothetical protein